VLLGVLAVGVLPLALQEFQECCPWLAAKLVSWAAARLPEADRAVYEAEWTAEVASVPGKVTKLLRAHGFVLAALRMRRPLRDRRQAGVRRQAGLRLSLRVDAPVHGAATITVPRPIALVAFLLVAALAAAQFWPQPPARHPARVADQVDLDPQKALLLEPGGAARRQFTVAAPSIAALGVAASVDAPADGSRPQAPILVMVLEDTNHRMVAERRVALRNNQYTVVSFDPALPVRAGATYRLYVFNPGVGGWSLRIYRAQGQNQLAMLVQAQP